MRTLSRPICASAAVVALGFAVPHVSAAASDTAFVQLKTTTPIAASQDRLVWSEYDATAKGYTLKSKVGSEVKGLPIATRSIPFDVDLGTDRSGNTVAVYSRCEKEPKGESSWDLYDFHQHWDNASGCKVYQFDFLTNQESGLAVGRPGYSSVEPSIAQGAVAYISFKDGKFDRGQRVYQQSPGGTAKLQETVGKTAQTTGCINYYERSRKETAECVKDATETFTDLELSGKKLAVVAYFDKPNVFYHLEVGAGSKFKAVAYGKGALSIRAIASPQIAGKYVYFAQVCEGECLQSSHQEIRRYSLSRRRLERTPVSRLGNIAVAGSTIYYENSGPFDFAVRECREGAPDATDCGIKQLASLHFTSLKK